MFMSIFGLFVLGTDILSEGNILSDFAVCVLVKITNLCVFSCFVSGLRHNF